MKNSGSQKERNEWVKYWCQFMFVCFHFCQFSLKPVKTNKIRLRIHHREKLVETHVKWYVNGEVTEMNWSWDVDYMAYMELEDMIKSESYVNIKYLWYWNHAYRFSHGLRPLNNDQDVLQFSKDVVGYDIIYVFKSADVTKDDSELDVNIKANSEETPNGVTEEVTTDPNVVAEKVTNDTNVDVNNETGQEGIDEDYVASEGNFEDSEFQFCEEYEKGEMD
ncbi:hypothetical protein KIW84_013915 [Lathyrus oleraceus]|uniref:PB1-like domain-containing protein n=1 Tax=Pisum sativum TaxID=3888 RepID=A0A9D5BLG2_PEA|nr:hypothetical protein KIW84_013915 [Pisum sativum]